MRKVMLALLALSTFSLGQGGQPPQPSGLVTLQGGHGPVALSNTPTPYDMYCSGFITSEKVPNTHYVVGGWNSPDQTHFASLNDHIYIYGAGIKEGDKFEIVRRVRDPNTYESYKGQKASIKSAGQPYFERGYARVVNVQRNVAVAVPELSCGDVVPGDIAIPFVEREKPVYRNANLDPFLPPNGKTIGRIIMANEFDTVVGNKQKVYLNIGADKGLKVGDYLRATRTYDYTYHDKEAGLSTRATSVEDTQAKDTPRLAKDGVKEFPRRTLGDLVVLHVHPRSATAMIMKAVEDIHVGDGVELMDEGEAPAAPTEAAAAPANATPEAAPNAPTITCNATPANVRVGESSTIACDAKSPDNRPVTIRFSSNGGKLTPGNNRATLDSTDAAPGPINVRATATDDRDMSSFAVATVNVEPAPNAMPTAQRLNQLEFKPNSAYVDNRAKAILDDVALRLQQDPKSAVLLSGAADEKETPRLANQRAQNAMTYLTKSKGIDSGRFQIKTGAQPGRTVDVWSVPPGAAPPQ